MKIFSGFNAAIESVGNQIRDWSYEVAPGRWQSSDMKDRPEAKMREILNVSFQVQLQSKDLIQYQEEIGPNLPWADDHFEERVSGVPLNPGEQWKHWPWGLHADKFRTEGEQFSHTYMERYWPKQAGDLETAIQSQHYGLRYAYGDLNDVINHLAADPFTRQAFLPIWFPEDTGVVHGERVPCTLGYHFILRNGYFHHTYYIRSCDFYRHFRDDLYLSVRLHLWVLDRLRELESETLTNWRGVTPGIFSFHCVSMHLFINDAIRLWPERYAKSPMT